MNTLRTPRQATVTGSQAQAEPSPVGQASAPACRRASVAVGLKPDPQGEEGMSEGRRFLRREGLAVVWLGWKATLD
jgi:hypothetical protein